MTLAELIEDVLENLPGVKEAQRPQRGEVKRLLNLAMREISLATGVPEAHVNVPTSGLISGPFQMPTRFHPEGVKRVDLVEAELSNGREVFNLELPVYSPAVAQSFHPSWEDEDYCGPPFLVYSPADPAAGFRPVGIEAASYRFLLHAVPEEMVEDSDEPFSVIDHCQEPPVRLPGAMPGYHRVLAYHVSYELLQRLGVEQWAYYYRRYEVAREEMFNSVTPLSAYLPGRTVGGESWRARR